MSVVETCKTLMPISEQLYREWEAGEANAHVLEMITSDMKLEAKREVVSHFPGKHVSIKHGELRAKIQDMDERGMPLKEPRYWLIMSSNVTIDN